ncbi:hypothetical protein CAPTEDRAFT_140450, partial [Capitella teleta]
LGLDDDTYRACLERVTGKLSAKAMSEAERERVIDEFKRLGWEPFKGRKKSNKPYVRKVYGLWTSLCEQGKADNPTRQGLKAFVKRQTDIDDPEWLTSDQANKVIEALKAWGAREKTKRRRGLGK